MKRANNLTLAFLLLAVLVLAFAPIDGFAAGHPDVSGQFPRSLDGYQDESAWGLLDVLVNRIKAEPFNLIATLIFVAAIIHTFLSSRLTAIAHRWEHEHEKARAERRVPRDSVCLGARALHFIGEVEVVFGLWAVVLIAAIVAYFDWNTAVGYIAHGVNFTEPIFVVVVMALASTRPILYLTERLMGRVAAALGGSLAAWWVTILTVGPIMGSFITEPAAMTLSALLLADKLYELEPSTRLKYATIGLLFVNVSVGGTLTHFAAPPVLMVATAWGWDMAFMFSHFGWKVMVGVLTVNGLCCAVFRAEFARLQERFELREMKDRIRRAHLGREDIENAIDTALDRVNESMDFKGTIQQKIEEVASLVKKRLTEQFSVSIESKGLDRDLAMQAFEQRFEEVRLARIRRTHPVLLPREKQIPFRDPEWDRREDPVPAWVILVHVAFLAWTIVNAHHPEFFVAGLLFFLAFAEVTEPYQNRIDLKPPLLVGLFLAGLVVHGGLQSWWIQPVLGGLSEIPLMVAATCLSPFNDNASITFLSTLVPGLTDGMKYAVVAGAVAGGGLTVIANAPNPAGQSILKRFFENGVSPTALLIAALPPTVIFFLLFVMTR
jgi:hypothetical protein